MAITSEEPVITRLNRLDNVLRQLEEMKRCDSRSGRSSCASTPSSGTLTSTEGHPSSVDFMISTSPTSLEKHCRPIDDVMMETQVKGTLIQRLDQAEERLLKLEEEVEAEKKRELDHQNVERDHEKKVHKKGIKQFVKQCVKGTHRKHKSSKDTNVGTQKST